MGFFGRADGFWMFLVCYLWDFYRMFLGYFWVFFWVILVRRKKTVLFFFIFFFGLPKEGIKKKNQKGINIKNKDG